MLRCPVTGEGLRLEAGRLEDGHVIEGALHAAASGLSYPIIGGVARLLPGAATGRRTRSAFNLQWSRWASGLEGKGAIYGYSLDAATDFIAATVLAPAPASNRWILDAGCGTAERGAALARRGHPVIAFDLSDSVVSAFDRFRDLEDLHLIQADILHPPFAPGWVDALLCIGVLHHTPRPREAFAALARLQRPGGRALVWIYPRDRRTVDPFLGKLYRLRDLLRIAHRLPPRALWGICAGAAAALYPFYAGRFRSLRGDARPCAREILGAIQINTYDFLAPPYQSRHSPEEIASWFREEGYAIPERAGTGFYHAPLVARGAGAKPPPRKPEPLAMA